MSASSRRVGSLTSTASRLWPAFTLTSAFSCSHSVILRFSWFWIDLAWLLLNCCRTISDFFAFLKIFGSTPTSSRPDRGQLYPNATRVCRICMARCGGIASSLLAQARRCHLIGSQRWIVSLIGYGSDKICACPRVCSTICVRRRATWKASISSDAMEARTRFRTKHYSITVMPVVSSRRGNLSARPSWAALRDCSSVHRCCRYWLTCGAQIRARICSNWSNCYLRLGCALTSASLRSVGSGPCVFPAMTRSEWQGG